MTEGICRSLIGQTVLSIITTGQYRKAGILINEAGSLAASNQLVILEKEIKNLENVFRSQALSSAHLNGWIIPVIPVSNLSITAIPVA
jgi:hypothetical protein